MSDSQIVTNQETGNQHFEAYEEVNGVVYPSTPSSSNLHGRRKIVLDAQTITDENVIDVLVKALNIHNENRGEIEYLYNYKRGIQPVLHRQKNVRPEITYRIVENRASEIVEFRTGYMCGESKAIQYIASCSDDSKEELTRLVSRLNEYMDDVDMPTINKELFDWVFTCGVGYKIILPRDVIEDFSHDTPFEAYVLDPRNTFVVHSNDLGEPATMAVRYVFLEDGQVVYTCYTKDTVYTIIQYVENGKKAYSFLENPHVHYLNEIPIIEYTDNKERMGSFEKVITILDAINTASCNRLEAVEQYVQALLLLHNVNLTSDQFRDLMDQGALQFDDITDTKKAEVKYISLELNQTNTQILVDHMLQTVREICGIPSMSKGDTSDSSNNGAVIMRQGWGIAEARAKNSEQMFKLSERKFIKLALHICDNNAGQLRGLSPKDVQVRFTRRNYEDIQTKSQVLRTLLPEGFKIDPKLGFEHCGLFVDPERAYLQSSEYTEAEKAKEIAYNEQNDIDGNSIGDEENMRQKSQNKATEQDSKGRTVENADK